MTRRLLLLAVVVAIGLSPIAHEFCQVSCASPASSSRQVSSAPAGHEHCAQAALDDEGDAAKISAARVSDCRSQSSEAAWTIAFAKIGAPGPAILAHAAPFAPIAARARVRASSPAPPSVSVPAPTQLRV